MRLLGQVTDIPLGHPPGHRSQILGSSAQNWPLGVRVELHDENPAQLEMERPHPPTQPWGKWLPPRGQAELIREGLLEEGGFEVLPSRQTSTPRESGWPPVFPVPCTGW